jgi:hypothetical protein
MTDKDVLIKDKDVALEITKVIKNINDLYSLLTEHCTSNSLIKFSKILTETAEKIDNNVQKDIQHKNAIYRIKKLSNDKTKEDIDMFCDGLKCNDVTYEVADYHRFESVGFKVQLNDKVISIDYSSDTEDLSLSIDNISVFENSERYGEWEDYEDDDGISTFNILRELFNFKTIDIMVILRALVNDS